MSDWFDHMLEIARSVLRTVTSQVQSQIQQILDEALSPIQDMTDLVESGEIWVGDGADRFVEEMRSECLPTLTTLNTKMTDMHTGILSSEHSIDEADNRARSEASKLVDLYEAI
jgi:uncharacterized protein YukE